MSESPPRTISRRRVLIASAGAGAAALASAAAWPWLTRVFAPEATPDLVERNAWPEHWETTLAGLDRDAITANDRFFVRSHFPVPEIDPAKYRLEIAGLVRKPLSFDLASLRAEPQQSTTCTLECAGNGRGLMPLANTSGTQWECGAVGTARWSGIPLRTLLARAGVDVAARHVWFEAADHATLPQTPRFLRSIPLEVANERVLLALAMNGAPLPARHGAPLRAVVPGWYGMSSAKWVTRIRLETTPSDNHFMAKGYRYVAPGGDPLLSPPVETMRVKSLITSPREGDELPGSSIEIAGFAWSGMGAVRRVEVSADEGRTWQDAHLATAEGPFAWQRFGAKIAAPARNPVALWARATDAAGETQPHVAAVNSGGYGNNAVHKIRVVAHA
jgi:DMSO/TMAO reductase YedYZ molybdopterin-dependent catalytic subunit